MDQYILTYSQLLTRFAKVISTIFVVQLSVVCIFSKKRDSLVIFQSLKWVQLNEKSLEHPLVSSDLPWDLF